MTPHDAQGPYQQAPPVIPGEVIPLGRDDPRARRYDPFAGAPPGRPPASVQPYAPPPGAHGAGPAPVHLPAPRSVGAAFVLTFFFGPFGMFYSTVSGALIMLGVTLGVAVLTGVLVGLITLVTLGVGAVLAVFAPLVGLPVWIGSIVWGCVAASRHNERLRAQHAAAVGVRPVGL